MLKLLSTCLAACLLLGCQWGAPPQRQAQEAPVQQWEYYVVTRRENVELFHRLRHEPTAALNEMAAQGWEYMGPSDDNRKFTFRRPKK